MRHRLNMIRSTIIAHLVVCAAAIAAPLQKPLPAEDLPQQRPPAHHIRHVDADACLADVPHHVDCRVRHREVIELVQDSG